MAELNIVDLKNKVVGKEKVEDAIFDAPHRAHLLHDYVVMQRRAKRAGTHSTLTRAEVSGTGKKPFRQKGTGNARQGTLIGPHQPGGGIQFGPKPRDYTTKLNRSTKQEAIRCALSEKVFTKKLAIIENLDIASGKTKDAAKTLAAFSPKSVLIIGDFSDATKRSIRNIPNCKWLSPKGVNVFDVLKHDFVLLSRSGLEAISGWLHKEEKAA